jgi:phage tail sheath protein FI
MPSALTYPGVYVEEIPSGVHTIIGVSTANTAFIDFFRRGPMNQAVQINSLADFERTFGGLDTHSEASYGIMQYYLNGGQTAWVIRVAGHAGSPPTNTAKRATTNALTTLDSLPRTLVVYAASEGAWGNNLQVGVDAPTGMPTNTFNLAVREVIPGTPGQVVATEVFRNLSMDPASPNYVVDVVNNGSALIQVKPPTLPSLPGTFGALRPTGAGNATDPAVLGDGSNLGSPSTTFVQLANGDDGSAPDDSDLIGDRALKTGIYALDAIDPFVFNLMCIPAAANFSDTTKTTNVYTKAQQFCGGKRAVLIIDIPSGTKTLQNAKDWIVSGTGHSLVDQSNPNSAAYFPRLLIPDPLNGSRLRNVGSSGTMAGVYARTDSTRGVWKAPAGTDATLRGASVAVTIGDADNGTLNPLGLNVLRNLPVFGNVSWGARTLVGADQLTSEWKYIPVRRTALYIEESLFEGLKWVVFEPNDEPLWAQIRLNVGAFMQDLFRQGAFQGSTPRDAYFVKCDKTTTTQNDIDRGIVNILVGFAPLKPAEFVVIKIQQMAGQIQV